MPLDAARDGLIAVQGQLIMLLSQRNSEPEARASELEDRLARLERAVSRNSGNSSMPPSADDLPGKTAPEPRLKRGDGKRRQGKQPGGTGRAPGLEREPGREEGPVPAGRVQLRTGPEGC